MQYACISAANIEPAKNHSASVRTCAMIRDLIQEEDPAARVEIVPLVDYKLKPCKMCGKCLKSQRCVHDEAFNQVFEKMIAADALFVVVPHYAPLPSKLMILTEKMEEIAYLNWCMDNRYRFPLTGKPAGVIGHGGQPTTDEVVAYYLRMLVEPVAMALRSVSMKVVGVDDQSPHGAAFGIQTLTQPPGSIFVDITHDWPDVRRRITPLVRQVTAAAGVAA